ncbi:MAG: DUF4145 domain-containing protein [Spirochaetia bacterium]
MRKIKKRPTFTQSPFLRQGFDIGERPVLPCPICNTGKLQFLKQNIQIVPDEKSNKKVMFQENWGPEELQHSFAGFVLCDNKKCNAKIVVAGTLMLGEDFQIGPEDYESETFERCFPRFFDRAREIIPLGDIPYELEELLVESFRLFWLDSASCANKIRICVEQLLDLFDVRRYPRAGKRVPLPLHSRIVDFRSKKPDVLEKLLAVKWIGNAGSHLGKLSKEDLLDGYKILGYAIKKLFGDEDEEIHRLARQINKRRKPRSRTKPKNPR